MILKCPKCNQAISKRIQIKMNGLFKGVQPASCEHCGTNIQWHHDLHFKLRIGGIIYKMGLLILVPSLLSELVFDNSYRNIGIALGGIVTVIGVFASYTPKDKVRLELTKT